MPGADYLRDVFNRLLVKADGGVAKTALQCVLSFQDESLMPYKHHLIGLVDDKLCVRLPLTPNRTHTAADARARVFVLLCVRAGTAMRSRPSA